MTKQVVNTGFLLLKMIKKYQDLKMLKFIFVTELLR